MYKKASIQKITSLQPLVMSDDDYFEVAIVGDKKVLVTQGYYQVGQLVVYREIDKLPDIWREINKLENAILLPLSMLPESIYRTIGNLALVSGNADIYIGMDVSELIGSITKEEL